MKRFLRSAWLMALIHAGVLIPLVWMGVQTMSRQLGSNPITTLEQTSGRIAISLLTLTLAVSPLARITRQTAFVRFRMLLGLYAFFYASSHVFILVVLDYGGDIPLLFESFVDKPFIWFGAGTFLILAGLAVTSLNKLKGSLGIRWPRLHRLVYLAAVLAATHYLLVAKGGLATLSGNLARPLAYAGVILVLLTIRLILTPRPQPPGPSA